MVLASARLKANRCPIIEIFLLLLCLFAVILGCAENSLQPSSPPSTSGDSLINVKIGIVITEFPMAPDTSMIFSGISKKEVILRKNLEDTVFVSLSLIEGHPQFIALIDYDYNVYGAALFTGNEQKVILCASSSAEIPIIMAPHLWEDTPEQIRVSLNAIRSHHNYSQLVMLAKSALSSAMMESALEDSLVAEAAIRIILDTYKIRYSNMVTFEPTSTGEVELIIPNSENAKYAGLLIEGPFQTKNANLSNFNITISNFLHRYLLPCRLDFQEGNSKPMHYYMYPDHLLNPGDIFNPSKEKCIINFDYNNLNRVDLEFIGPGGRGDNQIVCCAGEKCEEYWELMHKHLLIYSLKSLSGFLTSFVASPKSLYSWISSEILSLSLNVSDLRIAMRAGSNREFCRVIKETIIREASEELSLNSKIISCLYTAKQLMQGYTWAQEIAELNKAPTKVTFTMLVKERNQCPPGDCERSPGSWELSWCNSGTSYFSYSYKWAGISVTKDTLLMVFSKDSNISTPRAFVTIPNFLNAAEDIILKCKMNILFTGCDVFLDSPACITNKCYEKTQTYVTFTSLDLPEGSLFPGLASGYFSGTLMAYSANNYKYRELVTLVDAPFDSVRVYPPPPYYFKNWVDMVGISDKNILEKLRSFWNYPCKHSSPNNSFNKVECCDSHAEYLLLLQSKRKEK